MTQLLVLNNSLDMTTSASRAMTRAFVNRFIASHPQARAIERDLAANPLPQMPSSLLPYYLGQTDAIEPGAAALSETLIGELEAADVIVLGLPMYNFTVPASLKTWLDYVVCVGRTFRYTETGPQGLLPSGKRVVAMVASGGIYSEGPGAAMDFVVPYLKTVFGLIGVTDIDVVRAEGSAFRNAAEVRDKAVLSATALAAQAA